VISAELRAACTPLPKLQVEVGQDMRQALLQNRAESEAVHRECIARHRGVLKAVGSDTVQPVARPDRWAEFESLLKQQKGTP
jgi:hypothetical protein